ncbi:hypothetical protein FH972_021654 [Carpinus fangiana]|uniref:Uncharacterized protein n=1 Tax=Carpinus fangiana TaxID=176857 RepID=A0A5N6KQJ8_9ROSI|nr:hypothetical protein FH972_021654 [Carpinus fangiana]
MSLQVLVAHTGQRLSADPTSFGSLDAFKSWLSDTVNVPATSQILLTGQGKQAKFQALLIDASIIDFPSTLRRADPTQKEIFLYDRRIIVASGGTPSRPNLTAIPSTLVTEITPFPDSLSNPNDIGAWRALFKGRSDWAGVVAAGTRSMADEANDHFKAFEVIERALGVAIDNLQSHVRSLKQRYGEACTWAKQANQDHLGLTNSLNTSLSQLSKLPARRDFAHFLPAVHPSRADQPTLEVFVSQDRLQLATETVETVGTVIADQVNVLEVSVSAVERDAANLVESIEKLFSQSIAVLSRNTSQLMEEVDVVARKVHSDYEHVMTLPANPQSVSKASKTALLHTKNHLPSLREFSEEMGQYLQKVVEQRNASASKAAKTMQDIATIEAAFAQANAQVVALDVPPQSIEAVDLVSLVTHLPYVYGALLVEAVRRREWADRIRGESSYLAEDIASYREEEERRRKKWLKNLGNFVVQDAVDGSALNFELNLKAEENEWPDVTRDDISDYLRAMRGIDGLASVVEELAEAAKDLDRPSRRQMKKAKGFKMGSIHEAGNLKGSFLLRENDEVRVLREANQKLDDDLKSQRSRVRKLEDLLYKQGMASRNSSAANIFQPSDVPSPEPGTPETIVRSPRSRCSNEALSRKASVTSRRLSANRSGEEKVLARRIVTLEAELMEERQKRQQLEKHAISKQEDDAGLLSEIEEARSTKKDLMDNMEAQQREFAEDRHLLKEDISKLKAKNEELEDELDRILGSRDNERAGNDTRLQAAEHELEQVRADVSNLHEEAKARDEVQDDFAKSLRTVHETLSPQAKAPSSFAELINSLDDVAERSVRRIQEVERTVAAVRADKMGLQLVLKKQEEESATLRSQMQDLNEQLTTLRDEQATEKAKSASLEAELQDGRNQLRQLRTKFAEGETGSETLRQRVEEQASRASALSSELAQSKSHINNLDFELSKLQRKHQELEQAHDAVSSRFERRSVRDSELTRRLVARNHDSVRLLDSLGLSVLRKDDGIFIQRTSKLVNASQTLTDPNSSVGDPSASILAAQPFDPSIQASLTNWMHADDSDAETSQFEEFLARLDDLNLTTFSEAVIKLRRDVEWTGKKWKMEARHYRDKNHRSQGESNGKIAFRSFREGDLALFLPTRNQATRPWAAFNVGAPHYFLREQDSHRLKNREWLVARISKVEERTVNLSKTLDSLKAADGRSINESEGGTVDDDNPFELSDGLRWYMLDAAEEKAGAPLTPALGKSTVASTAVDAKGSIRMKKLPAGKDASTTLNKSLESRRSSSNSKRGSISGVPPPDGVSGDTPRQNSNTTPLRPDSRATPTTGRAASTQLSPPGLGIDIDAGAASSSTAASARKHEELHPATGSPATASLLGFLGAVSPPKAFSRSSAKGATIPNPRSPSIRSQQSADNEPLKGVMSSASLHSQGQKASLAKGMTPSKLATSQNQQAGAADGSPTKRRPAPPRQSAWESLWSLDHTVNLEDGKGKSAKS